MLSYKSENRLRNRCIQYSVMVQGNSSYKNFVFVSPQLIFGKTFLLRPEYAYFLIRYFLLEYPFKYALEYSLK